jgi:hypothetical protein
LATRVGFGLIGGVSSSYRFSTAFVVRLMGLGLVAAGVLALMLAVGAAVFSTSGAPLVWFPVFALVALVLLVVLVVRRAEVVRLDEVGYRIRFLRGAGVRQAAWKHVEDVATATVAGQRCLVLRLRDGRTSTVPVAVLSGRTEDFVEDLRAHLQRGHGYRPVPRRDA